MVVWWLAQLEGLGSNPPRPGPFCVEFTHSPRVCVGFLLKTCVYWGDINKQPVSQYAKGNVYNSNQMII